MKTVAKLLVLVVACASLWGFQFATAEEQVRARHEVRTTTQEQVQAQERAREQIYGYDLMSEQERNQYHERMRSMNTEEERNAFRAQHHEKMQERARKMNRELPEDVPAMGQGQGQSKGKSWAHGHDKNRGQDYGSDRGSSGKGQKKKSGTSEDSQL